MIPQNIPAHLKKYIVQQECEQYSAKDQAVWRFSMRQLLHYLKNHAHHCYTEGLKRTGIQIESIPSIESINSKLNEFGWGAIPVSGFIPPTAFMEFQSLGYLPIASGIRTAEHILYTPAPDIIHEAAGHAPILINKEFSSYLKKYAETAKKALLNSDDIKLYEAIRALSDIKEHPDSTLQQIKESEKNLENIAGNMGPPSEAALLGRMNWWTAEYGLILENDKPKIFGAGLLSSLGESTNCFLKSVKKIPISLECINYSYDITEEQPQLFTTDSFQQLEDVLEEFSRQMAFKVGGKESVQKGINARTVNTIQLNSGVQISGLIEKQIIVNNKCVFVKTLGPTQLCYDNSELIGHNKSFHGDGYSTIVDTINNKCLSELSNEQLLNLGLQENKQVELNFDSGFKLIGSVQKITTKSKKNIIIKFVDCELTLGDQVLFAPEWGDFDLALGSSVVSVFNGVADSSKYGEIYNFDIKTIPAKSYSEHDQMTFNLYQQIRELRSHFSTDSLRQLIDIYLRKYSNEWLAGLELIELMNFNEQTERLEMLTDHLLDLAEKDKTIKFCVERGLKLANVTELFS